MPVGMVLKAFCGSRAVAAGVVAGIALLGFAGEVFAKTCGDGKSAAGISVPSQSDLHAVKTGAVAQAFEDVPATDSLDGAGACVGQIRSLFHVELSMPSFSWEQVRESLVASGQRGLASAAEQACAGVASSVRGSVSTSLSRIRSEVTSLSGGTVSSPVEVLSSTEGMRIRVSDTSSVTAAALRSRLSSGISSLGK